MVIPAYLLSSEIEVDSKKCFLFGLLLCLFCVLRQGFFHCIALVILELAFIDQAGLAFRDLPALVPECWNKGKCHHGPAKQ